VSSFLTLGGATLSYIFDAKKLDTDPHQHIGKQSRAKWRVMLGPGQVRHIRAM